MRGREYPDTPMVGVGVIVFDNDSRILLIQRGNEPSKGLWALPGGLVELGEETKAAAKREVAEECSIEVEIGDVANVVDLILKDPTDKIRYHYILIDYLATHVAGDIDPQTDVTDARWVRENELDLYDIPDVTRKVINQSLEKRKESARYN
ncbi:NUDIX hydrolase [candidate division KSB1 bacterium]|nr:NUDIX hydrolase [candidate division KSB1 bacterium]